jgi:hypothetical protein
MFLGWQIFVCVSIVAAGAVSKGAMKVVALCWVGWTVLAVLPVYAFWVGLFQLANVGITYFVMDSKK